MCGWSKGCLCTAPRQQHLANNGSGSILGTSSTTSPLLQCCERLSGPTPQPTPAPALPAQVEVIVDEQLARDLIPQCKRLGASGIFTYNINVIIH